MAVDLYGKLLIVGKDGKSELEFPLDKKNILIGRDHACDIRIVNKEISRKHAELYTEDNGAVFINSMGREPVSVNGAPVVSPVELATGDKIEVHLEGRTRIFYFHSKDTVQVAGRKPLANLNADTVVTSPSLVKPDVPSAKKNTGDEDNNMPPPPPQATTQNRVEEPTAEADAAIDEEAMPMAIVAEEAVVAPTSACKEEPIVGDTLDKTDTLPDFETLPQEMDVLEDKDENDEKMIDATEKVEFPVEEDMMDAEPMMYTTEEEIFEEEEEENTPQLVSCIVSQAIAAALLAESNAKNTSSEPEIVEAEAEAMDTMMGEENAQQDLEADHPALVQTEACVPPSTAQKTKKSVRFTAGTPEGTAQDVTAALPFALNTNNSAGIDAAVMVDDDTMAFAQWAGFAAAVGADDELMSPAEDKQATPAAAVPDTLVKAKAHVSKFVAEAISAAAARRQSAGAAPDTLGKAKAHVSKFVSEAIAAAAARRQSAVPPPPPDTLLKAKAHVSKFVSEAIAAAAAGCATPQTGALAAKLTELEEEHDVTFELPADFMRWKPAPTSSKKVLTVAVAVNPRGTTAVEEEKQDNNNAAATTPATRTSLAPQELAAKLAELEQEHDITFELPADFMRWTPAPATAGKKSIAVGVTPRSAVAAAKAATPAKGMTPAGPGAQAPAPTPNTAINTNKSASKGKMNLDPTSLAAKLSELADEHDVDFELPADFMRWTPAAKRTVSIAVTPRTANAPASVAKSQRSVPRNAFPALTPAKGHMTPAGPGAQAPAPTPATAAKSVGKMTMMANGAGLPVDTGALATKLAQLAEQHDITFELPADFMRWTPAPGNKTSGSVIIAPASAMKSQQRSVGRSRMAQAVEAADNNDDAAFPEEVVQPVLDNTKSNAENNTNEFTGGDLEASLDAVASAPKATPMSKSAAGLSRRRSSIRTPGTKIAIIGRSTPRSAAPSSVKNVRTSPRNNLATVEKKQQQQQEDEEDVEMGEVNEVAPLTAAEVIEKEVSGETLEQEKSVDAINAASIAVAAVTTSVEESQEEEANAQTEEEEVEDEDDEDYDFNEQEEEEGAGLRRVAFVPLADYRRAVVQVRIHRSRATGLASQLRGVSARALRLKRAAAGLAKALEEERAKREELQATLQRIVANREAEEEDFAEEDSMDCDVEEEALEEESPAQVKVVVVGYNPAPQPCHTEMAGNVVVVRPAGNTNNNTTTPARSPMKATVGFAANVAKTPGKSAMKSKTPGTLKKSMRKTPAGGRVLDDVEVPSWVFEANIAGAPAFDVTAELAEVAAAEDAEARDAAALRKLHAEVVQVAEAAESDEEEDVEERGEADRCHKCNEGEEGDVLLLCDGCDNACHLSCCNPPLKRVPKGDWFCVDCKKAKKGEEAVKKASSPAANGRGKKRAAAGAPAAAEEKKAARGKKAAAPAAPAGTKRGRGATTIAAQEEKAPAAKKTRGGRQATAPASTEKPAAAKRTTRTRR